MNLAEQLPPLARTGYSLLRTGARVVDQRLEPVVANSPGLAHALDRVRDALRDLDELVTDALEQTPVTPPATEATTRPASRPAPTAKPGPEPEPAPAAADEAQEVEHLAEELLEEEGDHHTGELADNEDLRDVQARLRAKHAVQEQHDQHEQ